MQEGKLDTQVLRRCCTTAAVVSSQRSSLSNEPLLPFTQCEQNGYKYTQTEAQGQPRAALLNQLEIRTCRAQNPDTPRAGCNGAHRRVAGIGRAVLFANRIVRVGNNSFLRSAKHREKIVWNFSPETRRSEILCKPMEERNPRLTTGLSPVHHVLITCYQKDKSRFSLLPTSGTMSFGSVDPFMQGMSGNTQPVESKTRTYHGRVGSGRRGARRTAGRGEAGQKRVPTIRSAPKPTVPVVLHGTINNCSERLLASTNKGNPR